LLPMQNGDYLQRLGFWTVDDDVIRVFRKRPEAHGQPCDIPPAMSNQRIFSQSTASGYYRPLYPVGGLPVVLFNEPPDAVEIFNRLTSELELRTHSCVFNCYARRWRSISSAVSPSISSPPS